MSKQKYIEMRGFEAIKHLGLEKNSREFYRLVEAGKYEDNEKEGTKRKFKIPITEEIPVATELDLKDKHLEVKIQKELQSLHTQRLIFAEQIKDIFMTEFHLPRIAELFEVVRKYGSEELKQQWNIQARASYTERQTNLQKALADRILSL